MLKEGRDLLREVINERFDLALLTKRKKDIEIALAVYHEATQMDKALKDLKVEEAIKELCHIAEVKK